jgi:hypothetical protein
MALHSAIGYGAFVRSYSRHNEWEHGQHSFHDRRRIFRVVHQLALIVGLIRSQRNIRYSTKDRPTDTVELAYGRYCSGFPIGHQNAGGAKWGDIVEILSLLKSPTGQGIGLLTKRAADAS